MLEELYGLKIGDEVKYIGNDENAYNSDIFNKTGIVKNILPKTGEFYVSLDEIHYNVSFQRVDLLLLSESLREKVEFEGQLTETNFMTLPEMKEYLNKYHEFIEGKDFSITEQNGKKEVMLRNDKYAALIKDLFSIEKVSKELTGKSSRDFKHSMLPEITSDGTVSLIFKASDWTFRTHVMPFSIQYSLLLSFDVDIYKEWGFEK